MPTIADIRAQYPQYQDMSDAELAGALHSKFYADMPADEFAAKIGLKPADPVSTNDVGRSFATGVPILGGLANRLDAATDAALAPLLNRFFAPEDQLQEPTFGERYAHSLRDQEGMDQRFAADHPVVDTAAKVAGGVAGMVPAVAAAPGVFGTTGGLGSMVVRGGLSNAALGGADAAIRGSDIGIGAGLGGALGAGAPVAGAVVKGVAAPIVSNLMARANPTRYATGQVARSIIESGRPTADIAGDVVSAANEGQGMFTLGDALGNPGQRMMRAAASGPGEGRTDIVNFLQSRQAGQGRRVANALAEGFEAPETAAQAERRMTAARDTAADAEYGAVRDNGGQVDVVPAINAIDRTIGTGAGQTLPAANDTIEGALRPFRERLARVNPDDFEAVQRIRSDMADAAQAARQGGYGNRARLIGNAMRELDTSMEAASPGYRQANANFRQHSQDIDAIEQGTAAATRGRTEDTIPAFQALNPRAQQAYRTGYVDPLIADAQKAAPGVNKARPLLSDAAQDEAAAMAPGNGLMQRRLGREQRMFETSTEATGGSKTDWNLADADAMGIDPSVVGHILSGNYAGAARALISAGSNAVTGNTAQVRKAVADILLRRGADVTPAALDEMVGQTVRHIQRIQRLTREGGRAATGGLTTATNALQSRPRRVYITQGSNE